MRTQETYAIFQCDVCGKEVRDKLTSASLFDGRGHTTDPDGWFTIRHGLKEALLCSSQCGAAYVSKPWKWKPLDG